MKSRNVLKLTLMSASLLQSGVSFALPQVSENAAQNVAGVLTLYPDSDDSNLAYFIPDSAALVSDASGAPEIGFTYWGLDPVAADAGAFMSMSMHLLMDDAQKSALQSFLATGKRVAVVPFKNSVVRLTPSTDSSSKVPLTSLFSEFDFANKAGPAEADVGVNAVLTPVGARVFRAQLTSLQPLKFDYCYQFDGLGPKMNAHVNIRWTKVYQDFQEHASVGGFWFRTSIDSEIEKLRQDGTISIDIKGGTAEMQDYVKKIANDAAEKLFVSTLDNRPVSSSSLGGWSFSNVRLSATVRDELKEEDYWYTNQDLVVREGCLNLNVGNLGQYKDQVIKNADAK